jgi:hypothetical protein
MVGLGEGESEGTVGIEAGVVVEEVESFFVKNNSRYGNLCYN